MFPSIFFSLDEKRKSEYDFNEIKYILLDSHGTCILH